jgi:hypothetical protein
MRTRLVAGALTVAAAVALTGCGSAKLGGSPVPGGGNAPAPNASAGAAQPPDTQAGAGLDNIVEASQKAGTAKISGHVDATVDGQTLTVATTEGAVDFTNKKSKSVTTMSMPAGNGDQGGGTTVIIDGSTAYLQYDMGGGRPGPWMKFDLTAMIGQRGVNDMGSFLSLMAGITKSEQVGQESVHGVATTHYKVTIDPNRIMERYPQTKDFLKSMMVAAESVVPGSTKGVQEDAMQPKQYGLWVDKDGRIFRITQDFSFTSKEESKQVSGQSVTEYYDYGAPVDITPPPANEIQNGN